jgi:hypothetical protein
MGSGRPPSGRPAEEVRPPRGNGSHAPQDCAGILRWCVALARRACCRFSSLRLDRRKPSCAQFPTFGAIPLSRRDAKGELVQSVGIWPGSESRTFRPTEAAAILRRRIPAKLAPFRTQSQLNSPRSLLHIVGGFHGSLACKCHSRLNGSRIDFVGVQCGAGSRPRSDHKRLVSDRSS